MSLGTQPAIPSRRLLRYLRFQSEGLPFFSPNDGHGAARRCSFARQDDRKRSHPTRAQNNFAVRRFSMTKSRRTEAPLHSAVFDLAGILSNALKRARPAGPDQAKKTPTTITTTTTTTTMNSRRSVSTGDSCGEKRGKASSWQEKLWGPNAVKPNFRSETAGDLDECIFTTSTTSRRAKSALESVLRCTEVDEKGQAIVTDGAFKKSELIAKYGLMPRDLRKIDSSNLPHILVRPAAILLNLLHLRVLIKHDRVLLFDVYGSSTSAVQSDFMRELQAKLRQKHPPGTVANLPYEFRAIEVVLTSVTAELWNHFSTVQEPVMLLLSDLEEDVDREKLRILLVLSKKVSTFEQKARLVRDAIEELLDADDDLSEMYLTEKTKDISREIEDHTEVEMLLESYHKICDEVVEEAGNLVSGIRNTEEIIRAILDANRNALMLLDLKFSVGTLGLAMGTFLAGLYGMNLENFIEETPWGFTGVTSASVFFSLLVCWYGLVKLRKVQRVRMGRTSTRTCLTRINGRDKDACKPYGAVHWYRDESPTALLEAKHRKELKRIALMKEKQAPTTGLKKWMQRFQ